MCFFRPGKKMIRGKQYYGGKINSGDNNKIVVVTRTESWHVHPSHIYHHYHNSRKCIYHSSIWRTYAQQYTLISTNLIQMIQFTVSPAENAKDGCCCKEQVTGVVHRLTLTRQAPMSNNISNLTVDGFTRCTGYAPGVEIWGPSAK